MEYLPTLVKKIYYKSYGVDTLCIDSYDYDSSVAVNKGYSIITSSGKTYRIEKGCNN